jgi:hypothetical protein
MKLCIQNDLPNPRVDTMFGRARASHVTRQTTPRARAADARPMRGVTPRRPGLTSLYIAIHTDRYVLYLRSLGGGASALCAVAWRGQRALPAQSRTTGPDHGRRTGVRGLERECGGREEARRRQGNDLPLR